MFYTIYKTTCIVNNKIYIGQHTTDDINDSYIGSGYALCEDIKLYGKINFTKDILYVFDTAEAMNDKERELVNKEFVARVDTYNKCTGGQGENWHKKFVNHVAVRDNDGGTFMINRADPRYVNKEVLPHTTGFVPVKDKDGNTMQIGIHDQRYTNKELIPVNTGMVVVKGKDGNTLQVSRDDPRYVSNELVHVLCGNVVVRDACGKCFSVSVDDPLYLDGTLTSVGAGYVSTELDRLKIKESHRIHGHQVGEKNSQHGTMWITNGTENRKIKKTDDIPTGFNRGYDVSIIKKYDKANAMKLMWETRRRTQAHSLVCTQSDIPPNHLP